MIIKVKHSKHSGSDQISTWIATWLFVRAITQIFTISRSFEDIIGEQTI